MDSRRDEIADRLEEYRSYLGLVARMNLGPQVRRKVDASDVVQQTLIQANNAWDDMRNADEKQLGPWLRKILARNLMHTFRDLQRQKRDVKQECSLDSEIAQSSRNLAKWIASQEPSPSEVAQNRETIIRVAHAIDDLPELQRQAIELHYFQRLSLDETAICLNRSRVAVAGLIQRGVRKLRGVFADSN